MRFGRGPGQWEIDFLCCIYRNANTLQRVTLWRSGFALSVHHRKPQEKPEVIDGKTERKENHALEL